MNIILQNENGFYFTISSRSDTACLVEMPDFGEISSDFCTYKIGGVMGEGLCGINHSVRDVTIKFEARRISERLISRTLSPLSPITCTVNGRWQFKAYAKGTAKRERPHENMPAIYTVQLRLFDPCFYKLHNNRTVPFFNHGGRLYENGVYNYQKLSLLNNGDIPCPLSAEIKPTEATGTSGLFSKAVWEDGVNIYEGYKLGSRDTETTYYVSSDITDTRAFSDYHSFERFDTIYLKPGQNTLYVLNAEGTLWYNPKFLSIEVGADE